jgi:hypothetical protein
LDRLLDGAGEDASFRIAARRVGVDCRHERRVARTAPVSLSGRFPAERKDFDMALTDQLSKLATRAKEAEDHADAATSKAKADLQRDVKNARASAEAQAEQLRKNAETDKDMLSDGWKDLQANWNDHIASARKYFDEKKAEHDLKSAQRAADSAEEDAAFAINYAYAAIEEAEYAVLDATLARMDADELAATTPGSG